MARKRQSEKKEGRRFRVELGSTGILLWSGILLFLLVWIFALGILVGRESLPGDIRGVSEWKKQMGRLQGLVGGDEVEEEPEEPPVEGPKLAFYEKLTTKKDEARERKSSKPKVHPKKPAQREAPLSTLTPAPKRPAVGPPEEEDLRSEGSEENERKPKPPAAPQAEKERPAPKARTASSGQTRGEDLLSVNAQYTVQVAAMESREAADEMIARLNRKGFPSYYYDVTIRGKTYYRVRCGRFLTRSQAEEHAALLAGKEGIRGFVSKLD